MVPKENILFGGVAGDITAMVMENCFEFLDAPVGRIGSLETPVLFSKNLEEIFLPKERFENVLVELHGY